MIKKIIKILVMIAGSLIILLLLIIFFLGMGWLNGMIVRSISKQAAGNLNGELTIGSMSGWVFSGFTLHNILLTIDSDTILACREVDVQYNLKALLHKKIELTLVHIIDPSLKLIQEQDSTWNFMNILRSNEEKKDTVESNSEWKIVLSSFRLSDLKAAISPLSKGNIPKFVEAETRLNALASGDTVKIKLDTLRFITVNPDFELVNLSGQFISVAGTLSWKDVELRLKNSLAQSEGSFNTELSSTTGIELALSPFSIEDIRSFIPGISIYGSPFLSATLRGYPSEYQFNIAMTAENQKIDLNGTLKDYKSSPKYSGSLAAENLDASYWTHDKAMSTQITGSVQFSGEGFDPEKNSVSLKGKFNHLKYSDYKLSGFTIDASKEKDHVAGSLNAGAEIGMVEMEFNVASVFTIPVYDIFCTYRDVNASVLHGLDSIPTDLSGDLHIKGSGIASKDISASIVLNSYDSKIMGDSLDKFTLTASYDKGSYDFELPDIRTPYFNADATGRGNIRKDNEISFHIEPLDPGRLLTKFGMPEITVAGKAEGTIKGSSDSLEAVIGINLNNISYDSLRIGKLKADANIAKSGESYKGNLRLSIDSILYGSTSLRSADLKAEGSDSTIHADLRVSVDDSLNAAFTGLVAGFKNPLISIENLSIEYGSMEWTSMNDSASIEMNPEFIRVNRFGMESGNQAIKVNGSFAFRGDEDISLQAETLDLALLPVEKFIPLSASGIISSYLHLGGTSAQPLIKGNLSADNILIGEIAIDSIRSVIRYSDDIFAYDGRISQELNDSISVIARIPVHISFNDSIYLKRDNGSFQLKAGFDSLDLKTASSLFPLPGIELSGIAGFSADIKNTINDPVIGGRLDIRNGHFLYPDFGVDYKNIMISAGIDENRMTVDTFTLKGGKGNLSLQGTAGIQGRDSMQLSDIDFTLRADNFQALKSGKAELNLNSDARISGATDKSLFSGSFRINSSKINADYLTSEFSKKKDDPNPPLLVAAMQDTNSVVVSADTSSKGFSYAELFKDTEGEVTIDIPGNTWITGEDMNFELDGTMRVVMEKSIMNLFGDLNVKRGYYKIYGRSFTFSKGKITFTGGSEINPEVDFEIVYRFRDIDKDLRDLKLAIKGRMLQPELAFFLDDEVLEEKDALSYIAFGKSVNQLGEGEREKMSGQSIAMGAAVTQLSSALKGVLQESAGIDVFEVTEGEDWKSGNVTIGKYVTNKLFLGYERSFDFNRETKTANTEKVKLEYQILRNLILKATNQAINSGFDLILRKSWR